MSESPIIYVPDFLDLKTADAVFNHLHLNLAWLDVTPARREYWTNTLNAPYTYGSGVGQRTYESQPTDVVINLIRKVAQAEWDNHEVSAGRRARWEGCFLNLYMEDRNALNWHADDDPKIDHRHPIAVISVGGERDIMFRPIGDKDPKNIKTLRLAHGSLLLMLPGMQQSWLHKIPKGNQGVEPRISLTYRSLVDGA